MPRSVRYLCLPILAAAVVLTGCASKKDPSAIPTAVTTVGQPSATPSPTASAKPTPAVTKVSIPPIVPLYPNNHEDYAKAVIKAYKEHKLDRLGDLTTAQVQEQIIEIPAPNMNWVFDMCDGVAGGQYCSFVNDDGHKLIIKITSQFLGQKHAATQVIWED